MSVNAQSPWWIGGGLGAKVYENHMHFNVAPEVGYNINDQWTVALGMKYGFTQVKTPVTGSTDLVTTTNDLSLQPYVRYIGGTIGKKFSLFVDLTGDFGLIDKSGWAVSLRPGVAWAATDRFTAAFRFGFAGYDHGFYGSYNGFYLDCQLVAPSIGIYYTL
ncbi:MAG: hypothetical protein J6P73_03900 [Bacteroidales bacterium]|nr:hypothetical protein [Bacteroidales bacterium]